MSGRAPGEDLRAAERELALVQRRELALLIAHAALQRAARLNPRGVLALPPLGPVPRQVWRTRAELSLRCARADGRMSVAGEALLERLLALDVARWPAPVELAQAAVRAHDDDELRAALGYAHLFQGEAEQALRLFARHLRGARRPRCRGVMLEGLAAALLCLGRVRLSFGAYDQAADDPSSSVLALVSALYLALFLADAARARRAAARLDLLVDPTASVFLAALAHLRSYLVLVGPGLPCRPRGPALELFELLLDAPRSPAGMVCHALA